MTTVADHYAGHLAPVYSWMAGGHEAALARGAAEVDALALPGSPGELVVDLGAGFGVHAIPLARRGARVLAIDTSPLLLDELSALATGLSIRTVVDDLLAFRRHLEEPPMAVLCLGDTLTHLQSHGEVQQLVTGASAVLPPGGTLVFSFRDYTIERTGDERFIQVRADRDRILACFLEYQPRHVVVHDILHELAEGRWSTSVSHYRKLKIAPEALVRLLAATGLDARREAGAAGMVRVVATRP